MSVTNRVESVPAYDAERSEISAQVGDDVGADIALSAAVPAPGEHARIARVAANLRGAAIGDVVRSEREVSIARVTGRIARVVDFVFFCIYGLLGLRFALALIAARSSAGFTQLVASLSDPLYAPFRGIVRSANLGDGYVVVVSLAVALVVYAMGHLAVRSLLRLAAR